jgi:ATP-dependent DNA helicase RecG
LPFKLTESQNSVLKEIFNDVVSLRPMNRLIQGDVGSGKTVIAMIAMAAFAREGVQSVLMVPTEILAEQHYSFFKDYCEDEGVELLTGSSKNKDIIYERIKNGDSKIIIGTHALIQDKVEYKNLGFVVTDEQHRFGVRQRNALFEKGNNPNVLIMTATPIPRTLSLILYGDVDISIIKDIPKGRLKIKTHYIKKEKINDMHNFIRKNIKAGRQAFFICPLVEESDELNLTSVEKYYEKIKKIFAEFNVGFIFGKMKNNEKEFIMKSFSRNEINILVATTVIEVGIDIPNANIMVINDSERFGLAQLHQLRGRVGRGKYQSYCFLTSNNLSEIGRRRVKTMCTTESGFEIADKDLELRGPGEIIGVRQHGIPEFKIASLSRDLEVLKKVQEDVAEIIMDFTPESMKEFFEVYLKETFDGFTI